MEGLTEANEIDVVQISRKKTVLNNLKHSQWLMSSLFIHFS